MSLRIRIIVFPFSRPSLNAQLAQEMATSFEFVKVPMRDGKKLFAAVYAQRTPLNDIPS